jgi:hypothetical protein
VKIFGLMFALMFGLAAPALADTVILDPLHMCYTGGCTGFNGVTIGTPSSLSGWGFSSSPASQSGTLTIDLLIPNNEAFTIPTLTGTLSGNPLTIGAFSNIGTFSGGQDLTKVAGFAGASPPNPFSAYSGATAALDPGFTAYTVLQAVVSGTFTTGSTAGQTSTLNNTFSLSSAPLGSIVTGFLDEGAAGIFTTAQSSSLVLNDPVATPIPAALPLFATGLGAMGLIGWRKKRKAQAVA